MAPQGAVANGVKPERIQARLQELAQRGRLPRDHFRYLRWLKRKARFEPRVIYDIGASVLHWTVAAQDLWPDAEIILFDAFDVLDRLYDGRRHWLGVLSDRDGRQVNFYENLLYPAGSSYYREVPGAKGDLFPVGTHTVRTARALDSVVRECGFPPPDLVKIDVQGAERDVILGGMATLAAAERLIVEMQHAPYNQGAPMVDDTLPWIESLGWHCDASLFSNNGSDGDYGFVRLASPAAKRPRFNAD
jgi:FkbM family methyltransferase